jgi:AcrR family transcriptional regulator
MSTSPRGKGGKYHHGNLREDLICAAIELMETGGVDALTLRAAARRVGVSPAAPYRHFEDKACLLAAVAFKGFQTLLAEMTAALERSGDNPLRSIKILGTTYVGFAVRNPAHFRVMFGPEVANRDRFPELEGIASETMMLQANTLTRCQELGLIRPGSSLELGLAAWTAMHGCASLLLAQQLPADLAEEDFVRIVGETLMTGLLDTSAS